MSAPPWEDAQTPLGRAFSRAMDRLNAATPHDEGERVTQLGLRETSLMFSGLDLDAGELDSYVGAMAANYLRTLNARASEEVAKAVQAGEGRSEQLKRSRVVAVALFRGAIQTGALAGALYGVEIERTTGTGKPLTPHEASEIHEDVPPPITVRLEGNVPSIAERIELSRDAVQWVLDMEADRLDRMSATLQALGLQRPANMMRATAMVIRYELSGGGMEFPAAVARQQQRQRDQLAADQAAQLDRVLKMPPQQRARYLAGLDAMEKRHERERRELEGDE